MSESFEGRIETYVASRLREGQNIKVTALSRIPGGASRETFRFTLAYEQDGRQVERRLILRRDLPSSLLESERRIEFEAFRAFRNTPVPVPEMLWLEEDTAHLDHPFFIAEEVIGFQADPNLLQTEAYAPYRAVVGERKWSLLGEIAKQDPVALGYTKLFSPPALEDIWRIQLDFWENVLNQDAIRAEPIARAAIRWMRRNPPPPASKLAVVHGDYRTGNFLFDEQGQIHAILDWEMTHLGDPLEDLGWSLNQIWTFGQKELRGGLLPREEAIRIWEKASGLTADPAALHWWEMLASIKAQALWVSAGRNYLDGPTHEIIHASIPWLIMNGQDRILLELMGR